MKMVENWNRLPREEFEGLSLEIFKVRRNKTEKPDLVEDILAYCRGVGLEVLWTSLPSQTIL